MINLLDIHVEAVTIESLNAFDRIAMVDVQPHYFGGLIDRVDLVIDHHPEQPGYTAVFKDIRPDYGSTSTILSEHRTADGEPTFTALTRSQIAEWACHHGLPEALRSVASISSFCL
jgi:nanoRNase/pAp phosphatase (c-di-AMP/oligoRNAs hydrolase)